MKKIKAVFFDLDGTLVDSFPAIQTSYNYALGQMRQPFRLSLEEVKKLVGGGLKESFFDLVGEERSDEAVTHFRIKYREVFIKETSLLPYVYHVISTLSRKKMILGVISNKFGDFSRAILSEFKLLPYLSTVMGDGDGFPLKPEPAVMKELTAKFNLRPEEVIYVGDGPIDIHFCRASSVHAYGIATGNYTRAELARHSPDKLLDSLDELLTDLDI
ncbi:MAG: HAD family hydrolase [Nitrospiria bacterium]